MLWNFFWAGCFEFFLQLYVLLSSHAKSQKKIVILGVQTVGVWNSFIFARRPKRPDLISWAGFRPIQTGKPQAALVTIRWNYLRSLSPVSRRRRRRKGDNGRLEMLAGEIARIKGNGRGRASSSAPWTAPRPLLQSGPLSIEPEDAVYGADCFHDLCLSASQKGTWGGNVSRFCYFLSEKKGKAIWCPTILLSDVVGDYSTRLFLK